MPLIDLARAVDLTARKQPVAFATETVFGLGADATCDVAIARVYAVKGRPSFNPLIVHYANARDMEPDVTVCDRARAAIAQFWPGPLTLVLKRRNPCRISALCSAGGDTLAVRVPATREARRFIDACGVPLAAPSANTSGKISPTVSAHVLAGLGQDFPVLKSATPCRIGLESTVLDLSADTPVLLRPGAVGVSQLQACLGTPVKTEKRSPPPPGAGTGAHAGAGARTHVLEGAGNFLRSPGMLSSHYAPDKPVRLNVVSPGDDEVFVGFGATRHTPDLSLSPKGDLIEAAANLFNTLHVANAHEKPKIAFAAVPAQGIGIAINDRLSRAAADKDF